MEATAWPAFDIEGGLPLALARGLFVAGLFSVFGTLLVRMPAGAAPGLLLRLRTLFRCVWSGACVAGLGWLLIQTQSMADPDSVPELLSALPTVLAQTSFGHVLGLQALALTATGAAVRLGRPGLATATAALAVALQAGHGHAAAMYAGPSFLLLSMLGHLLAAGAWLGALPALLLLVHAAAPQVAADASRRFSRLASACVLVLAASAGFQFWVLVGGLPALLGTGYGLVALAKLGLFGALLALAAWNRFRLTSALTSTAHAKRHLVRSIAIETGMGLLVVLAAGVLTNRPPAMHMQPVWPFGQRLSLDAVREDPEFRREVVLAGSALAGAAAMLVAATFARRLRWPLVAVAAAVAWFAAPHMGLLLADAHPTSFYRSPTGFSAASIVAGTALYPSQCAACHGAAGHGDGPAAAALPVPPADLTAAHLWMHSDGELFWWLSHGVAAPDGTPAMPGFAASLSDDQLWSLIDAIRAHNAGLTRQATGAWSLPLQAPDLPVTCDGRAADLREFRGRFVRLRIAGDPAPPPGTLAQDCTTAAPDAIAAYATVSGIAAAALPGAEFLIDELGWLRAVQRPDDPHSWHDPQNLDAAMRALRAHPVSQGGGPSDMLM